MRKLRTVIAPLAAFSLVLAACGGDDDDTAEDTGTAVTEETGGTETGTAELALAAVGAFSDHPAPVGTTVT